MLEAKNIHKYYGKLHVLKGVNVTLKGGEVVALVGASGAGKSTLLQVLGTLDEPDEGEVLFEGTFINTFRENQKAEFRNRSLGFVFQFHHLLPEFTAIENVYMPWLIAGGSKEKGEAKAMELLKYLNVSERASHKPSELSGGEQQRIAVARALINSPKILLADEPTGNLDSENSKTLFKMIQDLSRNFGIGVLITTHNAQLAASSDRVLNIRDGLVE